MDKTITKEMLERCFERLSDPEEQRRNVEAAAKIETQGERMIMATMEAAEAGDEERVKRLFYDTVSLAYLDPGYDFNKQGGEG